MCIFKISKIGGVKKIKKASNLNIPFFLRFSWCQKNMVHTHMPNPFFLQVYITSLMAQRLGDPGNDNWRRLWESNKKSHRRRARAWLRRLSSSPSPPVAPTVPLPTFDSSDTNAMTSNLVIQSPEYQFLHWRQDMEKKQEEQARHIRN